MKVAAQQLIYPGISNPGTPQELQVEILGLKNAIKQAEERISRFEQVIAIVMLEEQHALQTQSVTETENSTTDNDKQEKREKKQNS